MNEQPKAPILTPLMALIMMLENEVESLRYCIKNKSGYESIVDSIVRILGYPQHALNDPGVTVRIWLDSVGLGGAFSAMYGDAFTHFTQWGAVLMKNQSLPPTQLMTKVGLENQAKAMVGEVYLVQILRFLKEKQNQIETSTKESNDEHI